MGRVITGLLEGPLAGFKEIPLRNRIMTVLKCMADFKGIGFGRFLKPSQARRSKGIGVGLSLKSKASVCFKLYRKVQLKT
jgi:hypothetical protein